VAKQQIEDEENEDKKKAVDDEDKKKKEEDDDQPELPKRFHASVAVDPDRVGRDAGRIADEILSHLSTLPGAKLKVSIEIEADIPDGAPEVVQRTVSENAGVLKFDSHGFEQY
jgi:hypothetical protein